MRLIKLTNSNRVALIDDDDYERVIQKKWFLHEGYAVSTNHHGIRLHRLIMGANKEQMIDHADRNRLNCQRDNLRFTNKMLNAANRPATRKNKIGLKGVDFISSTNKFRAQIQIAGKKRFLGAFKTATEAHEAYLSAAKEGFGDFAFV